MLKPLLLPVVIVMNLIKLIKKTSLTLLLILVVFVGSAQNKKTQKSSKETKTKAKPVPSIALGFGVLGFNGDMATGIKSTSFSRIRGGYSLTVEERIGNLIGVSLNGIYGKLSDSQSGIVPKDNLNFESKIMQGDLNLLLHFDNNFMFKRNAPFAPYLGVGVGFLKFDSYSDLKDKNGVRYNYWSDGSIRDQPDSTSGSNVLYRDFTYESKLNDSAKYANNTLAIPLTFGVNLKLSDRVFVNIGASYYITMTDWIDNIKAGGNDRYLYGKFALQYNFAKQPDESNDPAYETVDFSSLDKLDSDGDGVKDANDLCPGTPKNTKVSSNGCPEDSDQDGVPDYMDKEPQSKPNAFVDESGVTLTEKAIAERQKEFSTQATDRSSIFNENPSLSYLKDLETKQKNNSGKAAGNIPPQLKPADTNNDGYISVEEISKVIDSFFEGDSEFSTEKINDLLDYFFEQ